jgi:hypothetical protein
MQKLFSLLIIIASFGLSFTGIFAQEIEAGPSISITHNQSLQVFSEYTNQEYTEETIEYFVSAAGFEPQQEVILVVREYHNNQLNTPNNEHVEELNTITGSFTSQTYSITQQTTGSPSEQFIIQAEVFEIPIQEEPLTEEQEIIPSLLNSNQEVEVVETNPDTTTQPNPCEEANSVYCLLEPIGEGFVQIDEEVTLGPYLNAMFKIGVAIAGILGVLMIVVGGFQYMTTDSFAGKSEGRGTIWRAVGGVILALTSWLILNTIDPDLTSFTIGLPSIEAQISNANQALQGANEQTGGTGGTGTGGNMCQALHTAAANAADDNFQTCNAPGTNGGNLACAYLVDTLIYAALEESTGEGQYVGGGENAQLSSAGLTQQLSSSSDFIQIGFASAPLQDHPQEFDAIRQAAQPGDIITSPTQGTSTGHVGICDTNQCGTIISNSSSAGAARRNFALTAATQGQGQGVWSSTQYYDDNDLHLFRHVDCVNEG